LYFFFDKQLRLSYVGKARRLKARIIEHMDRCVQVQVAREIAGEDPAYGLALGFSQVIDAALAGMKYFGTIEIPFSDLKFREQQLIMRLRPPFNYETNSLEYHRVLAAWRSVFINPDRKRELQKNYEELFETRPVS
jgi:hypothetical protein